MSCNLTHSTPLPPFFLSSFFLLPLNPYFYLSVLNIQFNIRHISNVFQGLLVSAPAQFTTPEKFIHLWLHESQRVYGDRLVSHEDLTKYNNITQAQHKKVFPAYNVARFYSGETADPLIFCHFAENIQEKVYDMVGSISKLSAVLEDALTNYNEVLKAFICKESSPSRTLTYIQSAYALL